MAVQVHPNHCEQQLRGVIKDGHLIVEGQVQVGKPFSVRRSLGKGQLAYAIRLQKLSGIRNINLNLLFSYQGRTSSTFC